MTSTRVGKNKTQKWLQTFPKWLNPEDTTDRKEEIMDDLKELGIEYACVCRELHVSGHPHYHATYQLKKSCKKTKPQLVKFYKNKFPNDYKRCTVGDALQPTRALNGEDEAYVQKDGDFIVFDERPHPCDDFARELGCDSYEALRLELTARRDREQIVRDACLKLMLDPALRDMDMPVPFDEMIAKFHEHDCLDYHEYRYDDGKMAKFINACKTIIS